jgi:hypothetical protein
MITDDSFRIFRIRTAFRFFGFAVGLINFYLLGLIFFRTGISAIVCVYIDLHFGGVRRHSLRRFRVSPLHGFRRLFFGDLFTLFAFPGREIHIIEELFLRHGAQCHRKHDHEGS